MLPLIVGTNFPPILTIDYFGATTYSANSDPVKIFVIYASADVEHKDKLMKHFGPYIKKGGIEIWHDAEITAGEDWHQTISEKIVQAQIVLILVSVDMLSSKYIESEELPKVKARHERKEVEIIPVIVEISPWELDFGKYQALPTGRKPVVKWEHENDAYLSVVHGVIKAASKIKAKSNTTNSSHPIIESTNQIRPTTSIIQTLIASLGRVNKKVIAAFALILVLSGSYFFYINSSFALLREANSCYNKNNYKKAFELYVNLAGKGNSFAQARLGRMYRKGLYVTQNYVKALEWTQKSVAQGDPYGQAELGLMYSDGLGLKQDDAKAVEWCRKSAEQGNSYGQYNLGDMYEYGKGVEKDYAKAVEWYRKSAEQGNSNAQDKLKELGEKWSEGKH